MIIYVAANRVKSMSKGSSLRHARPIFEAPMRTARFPESWLDALFGESLLIVPDTNVLRQGMNSAVRGNKRGVPRNALGSYSSDTLKAIAGCPFPRIANPSRFEMVRLQTNIPS